MDYVADAAGVLPFDDGTFDLVYASHVLEHIAWFRTQDTLQEWVRVLKPGGRLEIWVPDGLKICAAFVAAEAGECDPLKQDPWYRFNPQGDPCLWANGRVFTYGDGSTDYSHPNWHRALFSERCLGILLTRAGLEDVGRLEPAAIRGNDHGWINLGMTGVKSA